MESAQSLLTISETARELRISESYLYRHLRELPHLRVGKSIRFDPAVIHRHFEIKHPAPTQILSRIGEPRTGVGLRRYQRGFVYKTGKREKVWYGRWREDVALPDGTFCRRLRNERLGTVREIPTKWAAREELSRRLAVTGKPSTEMRFSELVERWNLAVVPTLKPPTAAFYLKNLRGQLVPAFGQRQISTIGRFDFETFLADRARVYCRNTLRGMRASFGRVMSWAVQCEWLAKNPASGVKLPLAPSKIRRTILTPDQTVAISRKLEEPYATLVLFLAVTGLRISEAVGIRWEDFDGETLRVRRRIYVGKADTLKTNHSARDLPIPSSLIARMQLLGSSGWVFRSRENTPINPGNALKRYVRPALRDLGIEMGGWHDFRHTLATTSLRKWPTKVVSEILGHSDVRTTMAIYQHLNAEDFRGPLDEIASGLLGAVKS